MKEAKQKKENSKNFHSIKEFKENYNFVKVVCLNNLKSFKCF